MNMEMLAMVNETDPIDFNGRIMATIAKSRLNRYEGEHVPYRIALRSPEMKRAFARYFESMQANLYIMLANARHQFPVAVVDKVERAIRMQIEQGMGDVTEESVKVQSKLAQHGVTHLVEYCDEPMVVEALCRSAQAKKFLLLIQQCDELTRLLDTSAAANLIYKKELMVRTARLKRIIRNINSTVRALKVERENVRTAQDHAEWPKTLRLDENCQVLTRHRSIDTDSH